ncbi:MAG: CotH kinase family protein [Cryomorphaceae bacterium]|nr:CotH kinase family protein [Cryomorphaceae bacterium]
MKILFKLIVILSWLPMAGQVFINEIQSSNHTGITDEDGDYEDWIEIYNSDTVAVNIGEWYLSDKDNQQLRWQFPQSVIIPPRGFLLVWASGKDRATNGVYHTNFSISSDGEPIILSNADGNQVDRFPPAKLTPDRSFGRIPDGGERIETFHTPTPGASNISGEKVFLLFDKKQGYHPSEFDLQIISTGFGEIRYTLDGTTPTHESPIYNSVFKISSRQGTPNDISQIRTANKPLWHPPMGEIPKIWVIRAQPFSGDQAIGDEIIGSFWTGHHDPEIMKIPIVSLVTDPHNLFDYQDGIYVPGVDKDSLDFGNYWRRGMRTEKPAHFAYFDSTGSLELSQNIGLRINGGGSRRLAQKSLRLYARNAYGKSTFDYPFFPERDHSSYRRVLLNALQGDYIKTLFTDELTTNLIKPLGIEYLAFRPVLVFVNGEYWALHFLKERRDQHYFSSISGLHPDSIHHLFRNAEINSGSNSHYWNMLNFIKNADPEEDGLLDRIREFMDVENYIDYQVFQLYMVNYDWPHNNIDFWRPDTTGGRWRWIFYDLDAGMRKYAEDNISEYFRPYDPSKDKHEWPFALLRSLLKIPEFRHQFVNRFYALLETHLSTDNIIRELEKIQGEVEPYIEDYIYRWRIPRSTTEWKANLSIIRTFATLRPMEIHDLLQRNHSGTFLLQPNPAKDILNIQFSNVLTEKPKVRLIDVMGREISIEGSVFSDEADKLSINISHIASGNYLIMITHGGFHFTRRFVKINP